MEETCFGILYPGPKAELEDAVRKRSPQRAEYIEIFNGGSSSESLAGLELVYVSASGKSVTRKHAWDSGAVGAGRRVLLANADGSYAAVADHTYSGGLSASGGSVVLRIQGGQVIDALSWGTAASAFVETAPATAPSAGAVSGAARFYSTPAPTASVPKVSACRPPRQL